MSRDWGGEPLILKVEIGESWAGLASWFYCGLLNPPKPDLNVEGKGIPETFRRVRDSVVLSGVLSSRDVQSPRR